MDLSTNDTESFVRGLRPDQRGRLWELIKHEITQDAGDRIPRMPGLGTDVPLSFAQERMWFVERLGAADGLYNIASDFSWQGSLDLPTLRRAFEEVTRRHGILRSSFELRDGRPVQLIHDDIELDFQLWDLRDLPRAERLQEAANSARRAASEPFDLGRPGQLRVRILRLAPDEHRCLIVLHHIVSDGWSQEVLLRELRALYRAYNQGLASPLPELEIQYADYALWQRRILDGSDSGTAPSMGYWKRELEGISDLNTIPADHVRPEAQTFRGAHMSFLIPEKEVAPLRDLCRRTGATLFMALLTCFAALLRIYSGKNRPIIGTPVANRERSELEGLIGFFVNTLILRLDLDGKQTVEEAVLRTKDLTLEAFAHQEIPFERLVEELSPSRSLGFNPVLQIIFTLQNADSEMQWDDKDLSADQVVLVEDTSSKFDLSLALIETSRGSLRAQFEYSTDLFEHPTVERASRHLRAVIRAFGRNPGLRLEHLEVTTPDEVAMRNSWRHRSKGPEPCHLVGVWGRSARRFRRSQALIEGDGAGLTYAQLDQLSNEFCETLLAFTADLAATSEPPYRIGVALVSERQRVEWLLAIVKAGYIYVPLDPSYAESLLRRAAAAAAIDFLISREPMPWMPGPRTLSPDSLSLLSPPASSPSQDQATSAETRPTRAAAIPRPAEPNSDDIAMSVPFWNEQGEVRWIDLRHGALASLVEAQASLLPVRPGLRLVPTMPIMGELWIWEQLLALAHGGSVDRSANDLSTANGLAEALSRPKVNITCLANEALSQLAPSTLEGLDWIVVFDQLGNGSRPWENLPVSVWQAHCDLFADYHTLIGPDGSPRILQSTEPHRLEIFGLDGLPLPIGAGGVLQIAVGPLDKAHFMDTGVNARRRHDGRIQGLDSTPRTLLRAGLRFDPAGIEKLACRHEAVGDAVLASTTATTTLYIVPHDPASSKKIPKGGIRKLLRDAFPNELHPETYASIEKIPRLANGNKDRLSWARPSANAGADGEFISATERDLAQIWSHALGVSRVRSDSDFFELGGHSLLGAQILSRVHETFGVELSLRRIFDARTLAQMAQSIDQSKKIDPADKSAGKPQPKPSAARRPGGRSPLGKTSLQIHPVSFAQQRMWLLDQSLSSPALYNVPGTLSWPGAVDETALHRTLEAITRRHDTLRTGFEVHNGETAQVVYERVDIDFKFEDLSRLSKSRRDREAERLVAQIGRTAFDLSRAPLFRTLLIRLSPTRHSLTLVLHHIISDAWSQGVLMHELKVLYKAFSHGHASPLPALPCQYCDFAREQQAQLQGDRLNKLVHFWKRELDGVTNLNAMPVDRPRPRIQRFRGARATFHIPAVDAEPLRQISRQERTTLFTTLLTCFAIIVRIHSGSKRPVFGSPVAGRDRPDLEKLIGFFVNTLVIRLDLRNDPSLRQALRSTRQITLDAFAHQELPFERLVEALAVSGSRTHNPLFQNLFTVQSAPEAGEPDPRSPDGVEFEEEVFSKFDLTLSFFDSREGRLHGRLEFDTDLFDRSTIERLISHFHAVVRAFADNPEQPLSALRVESEDELEMRRRRLTPWDSRPLSWLEVWRRCLENRRHETAVEAPNRNFTYQEIDQLADYLGSELRARQAQAGSRIAVLVASTAERLAAFVAVSKIHGIYVPLENDNSPELTASWASSAEVELVVSDAVLPWFDESKTLLIPEQAVVDGGPTLESALLQRKSETTECLFLQPTWNGEGTLSWFPVPAAHLAIVGEVGGKNLGLRAGQRILAAAPSMGESWWVEIGLCLSVGATLCANARRPPRSAQEVAQHITDHNIEVLCLEAGLCNELSEKVLTCVETVVLTDADPGSPRYHANQWEIYGALGTGPWAAFGRRDIPGRIHVEGPRPQDLKVVDEDGVEQPLGAVGELVTRSSQKLGLLGRRHSDGSIQVVRDDRIGRRMAGLTVDPEGIERRMASLPAVHDAILVLVNSRGDLYVEPSTDPPTKTRRLTKGGLRKLARSLFPTRLVPDTFHILERLPRTADGAKDRLSLGPCDASISTGGAVYEVIRRIWCDVLEKDDIDADTHFFGAGGNSLLATRVVAQIRQNLMLQIPVGLIFEHPFLGAMAAAVEASSENIPCATQLRRGDHRPGSAPTSFSQERLWFLSRLHPESVIYNVSAGFRWQRTLDLEALRSAVAHLSARHETLRTTFGIRQGLPAQIIADKVEIPVELHDLSHLTGEEQQQEAQQLAREEGLLPFDLETGPLFRITLIRLAKREYLFIYSIHHIISDAWSQGILLKELEQLYDRAAQGLPFDLPELEIQFRDFASWQRMLLTGETLDRLNGFWQQELQGIPPLCTVPTDYPRPEVQTFAGAQINFLIPKSETDALRKLSREEGASLFMVLLSAYGRLIRVYTGIDRPVIGTPIANRTRAEFEGLIGFFVNTLALRLDLEGHQTLRQALRSTRDVTLRAYEHQELPFDRIVEHLQPDRSLGANPLFQLMFVLQNAPEGTHWSEDTLAGEQLVVTAESYSKFDITLSLTETVEGSLLGQLEYCTDLYTTETMQRLIRHYRTLLRLDPDALPPQTSVLTDDEVEHLRTAWEPRVDATPTLVEHRVKGATGREPDALALAGHGGSRTYGELTAAVDRLADALRRRGIGRGDRVGIHLKRGPELIESVLAILEVGAVYVPLAISYPEARLRWMAQNAEMGLLIASGRVSWHEAERTLQLEDLPASGDESRSTTDPRANGLPESKDGAFILYTSGSTGRPKGVLMPHGPLAGLIDFQLVQTPGRRRILQFAPISFDVSAQEIFTALGSGGTLISIDEDQRRDPAALWDVIDEHRIDTLFLPYVMLAELAEAAVRRESLPRCLTDIVTAGEQLHVTTRLRRLFERIPGCRLINQYGPTETHVVTHLVLDGLPHLWPATPPIGRPIPGARVTLRDRDGHLIPDGVTGEIYIGGPCLADGYWADRQRTAERFIHSEGDPTGVQRWYRTGDLGRMRADGVLDFLGRADDLVKIRGHAVTLGEIEATLSSVSEVSEAAVIAPHEAGRPRTLAAFVVFAQSSDSEEDPMEEAAKLDSLRRHLRSTLPDFMIPDFLTCLERLPKTPSGKIDRSALPRPKVHAQTAAQDSPPEYELEHQLATIWQGLLDVDEVSADGSFFELGGHSLLATRAVSKINDAFDLSIPVRSIFAASTVRDMATVVCARYLDRLSGEQRARALDQIR